MTLVKSGRKSMLVEMIKESNLEEIWWFAKSRDYQISRFCEKVQVSLFTFNYFLTLVMQHQLNQLVAMSSIKPRSKIYKKS